MKRTTTTFVSSDTVTVIQQDNEAFLQRAPEKLVDLIADGCVAGHSPGLTIQVYRPAGRPQHGTATVEMTRAT